MKLKLLTVRLVAIPYLIRLYHSALTSLPFVPLSIASAFPLSSHRASSLGIAINLYMEEQGEQG
jgi:hypothetical protein